MNGGQWSLLFAGENGRRRWPNEELVRFVGPRKFRHVVEVGCGDGANLRLLASHADGVTAADISPFALSLAAESLKDAEARMTFMIHDMLSGRLKVEDGSADLVVDCMVSQHLPWSRHAEVLREYRRMLRQGGQAWMLHLDSRTSSPRGAAVHGEQYDFGKLRLFPQVGYFCLPPAPVLASLAASCGFSVVRRWMARGYPDGQVAHYTIIEGTAA